MAIRDRIGEEGTPEIEAAAVPAPAVVGALPVQVLRLQRQIGNRATARLLARETEEERRWREDEQRVAAIEGSSSADLLKLAESDAGAQQLESILYSSRRGYRVAHAMVSAADAAGRSEAQIDAMFAKVGFTGLMLPSNIRAFVAEGNATSGAFLAASGVLPRAKVLMDLCNKHLAKVDVPKFRDTYGGAASAEFDSEHWKLGFPDRLAGFGADMMPKIIGTIYHEMRHAEQTFLKARVMAAEVGRDEDIAKELAMPIDIVREARAKGLPKLNATQLARVKEYYAQMRLLIAHAPGTSGEQKDYLSQVTEHEGHLLTSWIAQYGGR